VDNKKLKELKRELETQDNLGTDFPFYVVYDYDKIQSDDGDDYEWKDDDWNTIDEKEIVKELEEKKVEWHDYGFQEEAEKLGYTKWSYKKVPRFITAFFTRKSAEEFIKANHYHWEEPHIYVHGMWRNYEMQEIREALLKGELCTSKVQER
jgi:hypothetical protein